MARTTIQTRGPESNAEHSDYAPTAWHPAVPQIRGTRDLALPSGQEVLIRTTTLAELTTERVFLAEPPRVEAHHEDRILAAVVIKPTVELAPRTPMAKRPGVIYTTDLPASDREAILDACGVRDGR